MNPQLITRILDSYGITGGELLPGQKGYRNHSHPYQLAKNHSLNLIIYKSEPEILARIQRTNQLSNQLAVLGMPTRRQQGPIMQLKANGRQRYAALHDYLPGKTIAWEAYTQQHIKLLGKAMSDMHAKLATIQAGLPSILDEMFRLLEQMDSYFMSAGVQQALDRKLNVGIDRATLTAMAMLVSVCASLQPRQALHMDFVRGNVLFHTRPTHNAISLGPDDNALYISGVLDLEKAANGPVVFDIARTLAFLMVDCKYKRPHKVIKYFIDSGYRKRGSNGIDWQQLARLKGLTRLFLLHDFYKFLRHNPYESLPRNEHFVRTRDFLLQDGIIKRTTGAQRAD